MSLCERCKSFNIQAFSPETFSPWRGIRVRDVIDSAASSCHFCKTLLALLEEAGFDASFPIPRYWIHLEVTRSERHAESKSLNMTSLRAFISRRAHFSLDNKPLVEFHVAADPGTPAATSQDVVGRYVSRDRKPDAIFDVIRDWLGSCTKPLHDACWRTLSGCKQISQDAVSLPSRCIEVPTDESQSFLTLAVTAGQLGKYVTVSHRWVQPLTGICSTTQANIEDRLRGCDFGGLPRLFLDVITMCRKLNIKYVWIDALCIVQDDPADWRTESVKMAQYYQQSLFTFAATGHVHERGIFASQEARKSVPLVRLPYRDDNGVQQGFFYLYPTDNSLNRYYWDHITQSELLTRGWVFQEWALSRRIVCYSPNGFIMQCKSRPPQNELGQLIGGSTSTTTGNREFYAQLILSEYTFEMSSLMSTYDAWRKLVEVYSSLNLTKASQDRLVALSGVADEFGDALRSIAKSKSPQSTQNGIYVAGVWLGDITKSLIWQQIVPGAHERISTIPSWSWASIYTSVRWSHHRVSWAREGWINTIACCSVEDVLYASISSIGITDCRTDQLGTTGVTGAAGLLSHINRPIDARDMFPILCIKGKLFPTKLHGRFSSDEDRATVISVTHHQEQTSRLGSSEESWRMVSSFRRPSIIAGWANVEHPGFQADDAFVQGPVVHALVVSKITGIYGGISLGYLSPWHHAYDVLYLRQSDRVQEGYERLGVGRVFSKEVDQDVKLAQERVIRLV